jgi:hypothetical protein
VVDDNNQWFLLIDHVLMSNWYLIHVEYVRFFHQLFHLYDHILIDQSHRGENVVVDHVLVVNVIVIENVIVVVQLNVRSMGNIIHNNQDMFSPHMYDDVRHVEQVV